MCVTCWAARTYSGQRTIYEEIAQHAEQEYFLKSYHHLSRLKMAIKFLNSIGQNLLVLDAGCGDGIHAKEISEHHCVIGVDISLTRIKRAKERVNKGYFIVCDLYYLPFRVNTFDAVVLTEVIEHLYKPKLVLAGVHSVTKTHGHLVLDMPSKSNLVNMLLFLLRRFLKSQLIDYALSWGLWVDKSHVRFYDMHFIKSILASSGFDPLKIRGAPCLSYVLPSPFNEDGVIFRFADLFLSYVPIVRNMGAIQVCLCKRKRKAFPLRGMTNE